MPKIHDRLSGYEPSHLRGRLRILFVFIAVALSLVVMRLWYLQILKGDEFRQRSENNSVRLRKIKPMRGLIMDQSRRVLVENQASFDLVFVPDHPNQVPVILEKLKALYAARSLSMNTLNAFSNRIKRFVPLVLEKNISREKLSVVETHALDLPGVSVEVTPIRQYHSGPATAQLVGFTGEVTREELERDTEGDFAPGDVIGKFGIEKYLDAHLRGASGAEQVEVNVTGKVVRYLGRRSAVPGESVVLTIDSSLQDAAWAALGNRPGALVAIDPRNGAVIALVSSPSFDPNLFNGGISNEDWEKLSNDPDHPMENRAISGQYPPGSTYKPILAIAALEEGLITPETSFYCNGSFEMGNRTFRCWQEKGHGHIKLHRALVESCDVYFYNLGKQLGVERIAAYARAFGLGMPLGVDLNREKSGLIPTKEWKLARFKEPWQAGETISVSIGQGFNLLTPLQLAHLYATLGNGGILYRPQLIKQLESPEGRVIRVFKPDKRGTVPIRPETLQIVNQALWGVVNEQGGTGGALRRPEADVAGKTGTAQVIGLPEDEKARKAKRIALSHQDHALFACFAPLANPEIAVAVIVENAGHGGSVAAPVARKFIDAFFAQKKKAEVNAVAPQETTGEDRG